MLRRRVVVIVGVIMSVVVSGWWRWWIGRTSLAGPSAARRPAHPLCTHSHARR